MCILIEAKALGPIKQAKIQLRPLTVLVGPNNTGKTWLAYAIAAAFDTVGQSLLVSSLESMSRARLARSFPELAVFLDTIRQEGIAKLDMAELAINHALDYANRAARQVVRHFDTLIDSEAVDTIGASLRVSQIDVSPQRLRERALELQIHRSLGKQESVSLNKDRGDSMLWVATDSSLEDVRGSGLVRSQVMIHVLTFLELLHFRRVHFLPTERAALHPFAQTIARLSTIGRPQLEFAPGKEPLRLRMPFATDQFLEDYSEMLVNTEVSKKSDAASRRRVSELARVLEERVLRGTIEVPQEGSEGAGEVLYRFAADVAPIELQVSSSMVKELAALVMYVRSRIGPRDLLVIDEPEMNLHPEAQLRLMEFLAMLVSSGVHILMTTHSPYMVDHLANLMKAARATDREATAAKFLLQDPRAFVAQNDVSVYLVERGTASSILRDDGLIDWGTFGHWSEYVSNLYFDIGE